MNFLNLLKPTPKKPFVFSGEEVHKEMKRRKTKRTDLLTYLQKHGKITTTELWKFGGTGASSRIHELRKAGHIIDPPHCIAPGRWVYVYRGQR